jgi:hypothetical protein
MIACDVEEEAEENHHPAYIPFGAYGSSHHIQTSETT